MAWINKSDRLLQVWLLIFCVAALLRTTYGEQAKCRIHNITGIINSATNSSEEQDRVREFYGNITSQLSLAVRASFLTIATSNARNFLEYDISKSTLVDGIIMAAKNFTKPRDHNFILVITDMVVSKETANRVTAARNISNIFAVVVGVTDRTKQQAVQDMVGGKVSRVIHVNKYEDLEAKVGDTIQMMCPGVPTICSVKLKMERSLSLNITCPSTYNGTSITLQNATDNLLRCWSTLQSNKTIMIEEDNCMKMCVRHSSVHQHNCTISTANVTQDSIVTILSRLRDDCTDPLSEFYRKVNDYISTDIRPCPSNTKQEIVRLLERIDIAQVDWAKINNLAVLCLLPEEYCNNNVGLKNRIANLTQASGMCDFFQNLKPKDICCDWECGCRAMFLDSNPPADCKTKRPEDTCRLLEQCYKTVPNIDSKCNTTSVLEGCYDGGFDVITFMEHVNCSCESVRLQIAMSLRKCANILTPDEKDLQDFAENATDRRKAELVVLTNRYPGPVVNLLKLNKFAQVLPRWRISSLSIQDIDHVSTTLFVTLPVPKKLALTRQTLAPLAFLQVKKEIQSNFQGKGCGFVGSLNVSILMEPGHVSLGLALDMCTCSEHRSEHIPAKMDILCKIIFTKTKTVQEFMAIKERLCALCFAYILKNRPTWQKVIVADEDMKNSACDKIGQIFILPPSVLAQWALICTAPSKVGDCNSSRPSLMLHGPSPPSLADLAVCKDIFCHHLCHLSEAEINVIRQTLNQQQKEKDVGCLAYLDDSIPQPVRPVPAFSIPGSCRLKSKVIKRAREAGRHREKRSYSMRCDDITEDIKHGIVPSHVLDGTTIERGLGTNPYSCVKKNNLGDYHWDIEQAKAIFKQLRHSESLSITKNWTKSEFEVLGFIGLGFTPNELQHMAGLSNIIFGTFGAVYGWSPEQLRMLAQRYLHDNRVTKPHELNHFDLARLNHLVCGLPAQFVKGITMKTIMDSTPILGSMQRCEIEVLEVLAHSLILYHGPVVRWPEDHFSEFGIMLAGLSGEHLKGIGLVLSDYMTVPVVNHIKPTEIRKLTPEQTSLFSYDVSLALSRRGLCAWLTDQHKQGYLEHLCAGAGTVTPCYMCLLLLLALSITGRLW